MAVARLSFSSEVSIGRISKKASQARGSPFSSFRRAVTKAAALVGVAFSPLAWGAVAPLTLVMAAVRSAMKEGWKKRDSVAMSTSSSLVSMVGGVSGERSLFEFGTEAAPERRDEEPRSAAGLVPE